MNSALVVHEALPPNNGMHPTPRHEASHVRCVGARVMPGVVRLFAETNMNALKLILIISFFFSWSLGDANAQHVPANTIIRLERTDCFFTCPAYVVTISADGLVAFEGKANVRVIGKAQTRIAADKVRDLVAAFLKIKFFSLRNNYNRAKDGCRIFDGDASSATTSIVIGGRSKSVNRYLGCFPKKEHLLDGLISLEEQIEEVVNTDQWIE